MIELLNINKKYDDKDVLKNINLSLPKGKIISLIGANGAGKSTLLSIISRLTTSEGEIIIDDKNIDNYHITELSKKISILRQSNYLNIKLTVRELISFGRYPHSKSRLNEKDNKIIDESISYMNLDYLKNKYIDELSGGEKQRALIAMILAQDSDYIFLDEPLNNLDMKHSVSIMKLLRKIVKEKSKTVILVVHDINFASCYSDYIVALKNTGVLYAGDAEKIITKEKLKNIFDMDFEIEDIDGNKICIYYT